MWLVVVLKLHKCLLLIFKLGTCCLFCCCTLNPPTDGDLKVESALRTQAPSVSPSGFLDSVSQSAWSSVAHVPVWFPEWVFGRLEKTLRNSLFVAETRRCWPGRDGRDRGRTAFGSETAVSFLMSVPHVAVSLHSCM